MSRSGVPSDGLSPAGRAWLRQHPFDAHALAAIKEPVPGRELVADARINKRQVQRLRTMGIVRVATPEYQRRRADPGPDNRVSGHTYVLTSEARRYVTDRLADPRDRDGWCVDPDCGRRSIVNGGEPRCKCGAKIREGEL